MYLQKQNKHIFIVVVYIHTNFIKLELRVSEHYTLNG